MLHRALFCIKNFSMNIQNKAMALSPQKLLNGQRMLRISGFSFSSSCSLIVLKLDH